MIQALRWLAGFLIANIGAPLLRAWFVRQEKYREIDSRISQALSEYDDAIEAARISGDKDAKKRAGAKLFALIRRR